MNKEISQHFLNEFIKNSEFNKTISHLGLIQDQIKNSLNLITLKKVINEQIKIHVKKCILR